MRISRAPGLTLMACLGAIALTACGSSSSGGGSGSKTSKGPVRLLVDGLQTPVAALGGVSFPWGAIGAQAAAKAINAQGGIDGRQVVIDVCDNKGDPNQSAACARLAETNGDIAVVGTFDPNAQRVLPILQAEKIPYIGGVPSTLSEFTSSDSFQFDPAGLLSNTAVTQLWKSSGCTSVLSIFPANGGNAQVAAEQKTLAAKLGITVNSVLYPLTIADVTPTLSAALHSGPNCLNYTGTGSIGVKFITGARAQGFTGKIISSIASINPQFLHALGSQGNGILVLSPAQSAFAGGSGVAQFRQQMASYLKNNQSQLAMDSNEFAQAGWSSVQLVKQALSGVGSTGLTAATLLSKIPTMCSVDLGNFYPKISFCKPVRQSKLYPRVYNDEFQYFVSHNGVYVPVNSRWHNAVSTIPAG